MSIYDHTGPHHLECIPLGRGSMHTGRPLYRVLCRTCGVMVKVATTSPSNAVGSHIDHPELDTAPIPAGS